MRKEFEEIEREVTPRKLQTRKSNTLLISMKVRKSKPHVNYFALSPVRAGRWKVRVRDREWADIYVR